MTQLQVLKATQDLPDQGERVRAAIEQGQLETAKKLLLDYARELDRVEPLDEAVALAGQLSRAVRAQELDGVDNNAEQNRVTKAMLRLVRELEEHEKHSAPAPVPASGPVPKVASLKAAANDIRVAQAPHTDLERAQDEFSALEEAKRDFNGEAVVACSRLGKLFSLGSQKFELRDVSFELHAGELLGLVGENGSGKTTLLRLLAGEVRHSHGELRYPKLGAAQAPLDYQLVRPKVAYVPQAPEPWYGELITTLYLTAAHGGLHGKKNEKVVNFWVHRLGLDRYAHHTWKQISGGYKMRFELARALVRQPKLLILDEPLAPLDVIAQRTFLQDLSDLCSSKRYPLPIIVSSQHLYEIELIADRLLFLHEGSVGYYGAPNEFRSKDATNLFELACDWTRDELSTALLAIGECRVEAFGKRYLVHTPEIVNAQRLLACLMGRGATVEYFHDLTNSTRRLFEEGRRYA